MKNFKLQFFGLTCLIALLVTIPVFAAPATITTQVEVGNSAPSFSLLPVEGSGGSTATSPYEADVVYQMIATGTDVNADGYYLIICSNGGTAVPDNNAAPYCTSGEICLSDLTTSGDEASCAFSSGAVDQVINWTAYVCDYSSQSMCSAGSSGSGDTGSPIYLNHAPTFTNAPSKPAMAPGATATFTVADTDWNDTDDNTTQDTGKLIVCATAGITAGACDGVTLCTSSDTNPGSALSCVFDDSANPVKAAGDYNAYVYVVDSHNLAATGTAQGTNVGYTIDNADPVISDISINNGLDVNLSSSGNVDVVVSATITDQNGCMDLEVSPLSGNLYRSPSYNSATCTTDSSFCYVLSACTADLVESCSGASDSTVKYNCTVSMFSYTDPTDGTVANNLFAADTWKTTLTGTDLSAGSATETIATGVEINRLLGMTASASISFGSLSPNVPSNSGLISAPVSITNMGNVGIDVEIMGNGPGLCTDYDTCSGDIIPLSAQKWEYLNNTTTYASGTHTLTGGWSTADLHITKPSHLATTTSGSIYWGILIPEGQAYGNYTGSNSVDAIASSPANW